MCAGPHPLWLGNTMNTATSDFTSKQYQSSCSIRVDRHLNQSPSSYSESTESYSCARSLHPAIMYLRGPSKSTPANVQCQKCLKRDELPATNYMVPQLTFLARHYSYECKASTQERPYVPRPSRTQQLFNPKLAPKLASETTNALQDTYVSCYVKCVDFC